MMKQEHWSEVNKIDILLSTYNGDKFLKQLLNSLIDQSYTKWTLIIRDDCSCDQTVTIISEYIQKYPDKIIFIEDNERLGAMRSFSKLMNYSKARYIMFCDQDDIWLNMKIDITFKKMLELETQFPDHPLLVHTDLIVTDQNEQIISSSFWAYQNLNPQRQALNEILVQNVVTGCTVMINKSLKEKAETISEMAIMHDWWLALIASFSNSVYHLNEPTILYRQHGNNNVGAQKYSLSSYIKKFGIARTNVLLIVKQAQALCSNYQNELSPSQMQMLTSFGSLLSIGKIARLRMLQRYSIKKHGVIRRAGFNILLLILNKRKTRLGEKR